MDSDSDEEMQMEETVGIQLESIFDEEATAEEYDSDNDIEQHHGYIMSRDNAPYLNIESPPINIIINSEEQDYATTEKETGKYYIGTTVLICRKYYLMNASISSESFLKYDYAVVANYLNEINSFYYVQNNNIEIMKLYIDTTTNERKVILKTFWLRIIQRRWKRITRERAEIYKKRCSIQNMKHREIRGKHLYGLNVLPSLLGMM
jgi:hypothetical protein